MCLQTCPDSCQTIVRRQETSGNGSIDVTESIGEHCPDQFPEPRLWALTCEILYASSDPEHERDCDEMFSTEACEAAFDLCLPPA